MRSTLHQVFYERWMCLILHRTASIDWPLTRAPPPTTVVLFSPLLVFDGLAGMFSFLFMFCLFCLVFLFFSFFHLHLRRVYGHRSKTTPQPRMVCVTRRRVTFSLPTRPQCTSTRSSQFDTIQPCGRVFSASSRLQSKEYPVVWCECSIKEEKLKEKKHIRSLCQFL